MLEANFKSLGGKVTIKVVGEDTKDLFRQLAAAQEVFDADYACGCCNSVHLRYNYRVADSFSFYELKCIDCGAALSFGQRKDGSGLFPKRSGEGTENGWSKYEGAGAF